MVGLNRFQATGIVYAMPFDFFMIVYFWERYSYIWYSNEIRVYMVPRTKHVVIVVGALSGVLGAFVVAFGLLSLVPHIESIHAPALLISGVMREENESFDAIVPTETTREDARKRMVRTLTLYTQEHGEEEIAESSVDTEEVSPAPEPSLSHTASEVTTVKLCDPRASIAQIPSWGSIHIEVSEGARIIRKQGDVIAPVLQLPLEPLFQENPSCIPIGMIGILLDGTVLVPNSPVADRYEGLAGYAIDGFPIYASNEDGRTLTSKDLDECHGHMHEIVADGVVRSVYHYHLSSDAPYALSCFRGVPVPI